ncbi:MAG: hypothetical protein K9K78_02590 [Spirochaetales bacterium]|nr:hypothetical protein [Spirochaetales bacterium]
MSTIHLVAFLLPQHISLSLQKLSTELLRRKALVSVRALPPLVPLFYASSPIFSDYLQTAESQREVISISGISLYKGGLFLDILPDKTGLNSSADTEEERLMLTQRILSIALKENCRKELAIDEREDCIPLYPGIFLASLRDRGEIKKPDAALGGIAKSSADEFSEIYKQFISSEASDPLKRPFRLSQIADITMEFEDEQLWWEDFSYSVRKVLSLA